jgi:hypothetical protein
MTMTSTAGGTTSFDYRIGLVAPSRVGKSTLIASLLAEGQEALAGTPVALRPADAPTGNRLAAAVNTVNGSIRAGRFSPEHGVPPTSDPSSFRLRLEAGTEETSILFDILDYPGAWLEDGAAGSNESDWAQCRDFLERSTVLVIPVDSVLVMEGEDHPGTTSNQLALFQIEQLARDWARRRSMHEGEPALAVLCPVKCETYFADNGGLQDHSGTLQERVLRHFEDVLKAIREEHAGTRVCYLPVDTFGCVELISARWVADPHAVDGRRLTPKYRVRPPGAVGRKGLDDLLRLLCRQLVDAATRRAEHVSRDEGFEAQRRREIADQREGFFRDFWLDIIGERSRRQSRAVEQEERWKQALGKAQSLQDVLTLLAKAPAGEGIRPLN